MSAQKTVVIVGGGFAGIEAARGLSRSGHDVKLVDRHNHHLFQPLLYQVATGGLNPSDIAQPIRRVLRGHDARVLLGDVQSVDLANKRLDMGGGWSVPYDALVLATGATHSYFGNDAWAAHAPGLKTIEDALDIRRRVYFAYEAAERESDPVKRAAWLTFVVVGGGATGCELAGALAEIAHHTLTKDFRSIRPSDAKVILVEGTDRVLPAFVPELSEKARAQLHKLGVDIRTGVRVTNVDGEGVTLGEVAVPAKTVLWGAGVAGSKLLASLGAPLDRAGRVKVNPDLSIPGHPEVFVVGDAAFLEQDGKQVFGVAPAAMQAGRFVAKAIRTRLAGGGVAPFKYVDKGSLATLGRSAAIADLNGFKLSGYLAWMAWLFIHVLFLIGFRNRLLVLFQWAWSYVTYDRGARLITGPVPGAKP